MTYIGDVLEHLGLGEGAGEAVEDVAGRAIRLRKALRKHGEDKGVGDERARGGGLGELVSEGGLSLCWTKTCVGIDMSSRRAR